MVNCLLTTVNVRSQLISITLKIVDSVVQPACMLANVSMLDIHLIVLTDVKERNPLTRRTLSIAISRVKHIKDKCLFWKVDS